MNLSKSLAPAENAERDPPRQRILAAASDLFYRHGIRAIGVDAIAEAAGTNKMTLYRHFASKDELVAEYLREFAERVNAAWAEIEAAHPDDPQARLRLWLAMTAEHIANKAQRGCACSNAAVELPEQEHPARRVIEAFKKEQREKLARLCGAAGLAEPELLAEELFLMIEGARVSAQSIGADGIGAKLVRMGEAIIASHAPKA